MTPYGMVADALYNIFGEGTQPPSALLSADEMLVKCARELDLEAPWYWLMGVRHFSVFPELKIYQVLDVPVGVMEKDAYWGMSVKPGHVYPFSYGSDPALMLSDGPVDQKSFTDQFKNIRGVYVADNSIRMENELAISDRVDKSNDTDIAVSGYIAYGNMEPMKRIDREIGEKLLSTVPVSLENGMLTDPNTYLKNLLEQEVEGEIEKISNTGRVIGRPAASAKPKYWFFGTDPVFQSYRDRLNFLNPSQGGFLGEAFCMNVFPRPDKEYTIVAIGEMYTTIVPPNRAGAIASSEGSIAFGNGDLSTSSIMYEKTLVNLLTKSMAMKFNYPAIAQNYEREYLIALDKLRSDNDRKLSYGLKLEYNDL